MTEAMKHHSTQHFTAQAQLCLLVKQELNIQSWSKIAHQYGPKFVSEIVHRVYGPMYRNLPFKFYKGKLTKRTMSIAKEMLVNYPLFTKSCNSKPNT